MATLMLGILQLRSRYAIFACSLILFLAPKYALSQAPAANTSAPTGCPVGATCDAGYSTLALACSAAGTGTLYLTRTWSSLATQKLNCNIYALANGIIKPAGGQTITISGSFGGVSTQHIDPSAGGKVEFTGSSTESIPQWFGAKCDGSTDDAAALLPWVTSSSRLSIPGGEVCTTSQTVHFTVRAHVIAEKATLRAHAGLSGPVAQIDSGQMIISGLILDGNSTASPTLVVRCGSEGLIDGIAVINSAGDGITFHNTLTTPPSAQCPKAGNNDSMVWNNPLVLNNEGNGMAFTNGDTDDSIIVINGGMWQNNGTAAGARGMGTAGIYISNAGLIASGWTLINPSFEGNYGYGIDIEASGGWHIINPSQELNNQQGKGAPQGAQHKDGASGSVWDIGNWQPTMCTSNSPSCIVYANPATATFIGHTSRGVFWDLPGGNDTSDGWGLNYRGVHQFWIDDKGNPYMPTIANGGGALVAAAGTGQISTARIGTFTPTITVGGSGTGIAYTTQQGTYITQGHQTTVQITLHISSLGGLTGAVCLAGIPAALYNGANGGGQVLYSSGMASLTSQISVMGPGGSTAPCLWETSSAGSAQLQQSNFSTPSQLIVTMTYQN